jgi:hypothetical protein
MQRSLKPIAMPHPLVTIVVFVLSLGFVVWELKSGFLLGSGPVAWSPGGRLLGAFLVNIGFFLTVFIITRWSTRRQARRSSPKL